MGDEQEETKPKSAMNAQKRRLCWNARDQYLECHKLYSKNSEDLEKNCGELLKAFEGSCPNTWFKHFLRQHEWTEYKKEVLYKRSIDGKKSS